jgi:hypothetical protein
MLGLLLARRMVHKRRRTRRLPMGACPLAKRRIEGRRRFGEGDGEEGRDNILEKGLGRE